MIKRLELSIKKSCFNRAEEDELIFVLLARDPAAAVAIEAWSDERIRLGKNDAFDRQIIEARFCAARMRKFAARRREESAQSANAAQPQPTPAATEERQPQKKSKRLR